MASKCKPVRDELKSTVWAMSWYARESLADWMSQSSKNSGTTWPRIWWRWTQIEWNARNSQIRKDVLYAFWCRLNSLSRWQTVPSSMHFISKTTKMVRTPSAALAEATRLSSKKTRKLLEKMSWPSITSATFISKTLRLDAIGHQSTALTWQEAYLAWCKGRLQPDKPRTISTRLSSFSQERKSKNE